MKVVRVFEQCRIMAEVETGDLVKKELSLIATSSSACPYTPPCVVSLSLTHKVFSIVLWKGSNQVTQEVFTLIGTLA